MHRCFFWKSNSFIAYIPETKNDGYVKSVPVISKGSNIGDWAQTSQAKNASGQSWSEVEGAIIRRAEHGMTKLSFVSFVFGY